MRRTLLNPARSLASAPEREFGIPMTCVDARGRTHEPIRGGWPDVQHLFAPGSRMRRSGIRAAPAPVRGHAAAAVPDRRLRSAPVGGRPFNPFRHAARLSALPAPHAADGLPSSAALGRGRCRSAAVWLAPPRIGAIRTGRRRSRGARWRRFPTPVAEHRCGARRLNGLPVPKRIESMPERLPGLDGLPRGRLPQAVGGGTASVWTLPPPRTRAHCFLQRSPAGRDGRLAGRLRAAFGSLGPCREERGAGRPLSSATETAESENPGSANF